MLLVTDLPGIYSLSPYTLEEVVAQRIYRMKERPERHPEASWTAPTWSGICICPLSWQSLVFLMVDGSQHDGRCQERTATRSSYDKSCHEVLGCKVVGISALKGDGIMEAAKKAVFAANQKKAGQFAHSFSDEVEVYLKEIEEVSWDWIFRRNREDFSPLSCLRETTRSFRK